MSRDADDSENEDQEDFDDLWDDLGGDDDLGESGTNEAPASYAQERLWFLDRLMPGSAVYHIPAVLRLEGVLQVEAVREALSDVVARHEVLRTSLVEGEAGLVQRIESSVEVPFVIEDAEALAEARLRAEELVSSPFTLSEAPLLRGGLLRLGPEDHVLVLVMHHVVSDGWSMSVLVQEWRELYLARVEGRDARLAPLPVQYADYAVWQRRWLEEGGELERQLGYWREQLSGAPPVLELPLDHPRPKTKSVRGGSVGVSLGADVMSGVEGLAQEVGATPFMVLLAAWQQVLGGFAGTVDVVVGTPIAGRRTAEVEGLIGFFVNTLVLRTDLSGTPTFRELLERVKEVTLGAYAHQDVPFEKLVAELGVDRSTSVTPVFQVMLVLQTGGESQGSGAASPEDAEGTADGRVRMTPLGGAGGGDAKFDMTLSLMPTGQGALEYDASLFEAETVGRLARGFERFVRRAVVEPSSQADRLLRLEADERSRMLDWSWGDRTESSSGCVHEAVSASARRSPAAAAVRRGEEVLTYGDLESRSSQVARALRARGVGVEDVVGVLVERSLEYVVGVLGVLKSGASYLPIDPGYPRGRMEFMLEDGGCVSLVTTRSASESLGDVSRWQPLWLDAGSEVWTTSDAPLVSRTSPWNAAYVIYTSGTTGRPKGSVVSHGSLYSEVHSALARYGHTESSRVLLGLALAFDGILNQLYPPLFAGASLVVPESDELAGEGMARRIASSGVTFVSGPPGVIGLLPEEGLPSLRTMVTGGEAPPAEFVRRSTRVRELWNEYGPTENTVCSAAHRCDGTEGKVPVGHPMPRVSCYVLTSELMLSGQGAIGELCLGGAQVSRGYLGRAMQTASQFVPDPNGVEPGARMYRTGDLARWRLDGELDFLGRIDQQVKLRGQRVELGEIESLLEESESLQHAVVGVQRHADGEGERLVGYVVCASGASFDATAEEARLRERVPEYMVPRTWVELDQLPLTPNGWKVDRSSLPEPGWGTDGDYEEPQTDTERALAEIWCELLGLDRVGRRDDFFALGGHSLLATRLASQVRTRLEVELPLGDVFTHPELSALARAVDEAGGDALPPLTLADRSVPLPLSYAQERLWFLDRLTPQSAAYHIPAVLRVEGALDAEAFEAALSDVVSRHEVLRTSLVEGPDGPRQVIASSVEVPFVVEEVSDEEAVRARAMELVRAPFDLSSAPLIRAGLLRLGPEDHVLVFVMHHVASDGWSMPILVREWSELYASRVEGRAARLRELPVQYADYAVWQRRWLEEQGELEHQLGYWREQLSGAPPVLELPLDRPRPKVKGDRGGVVPVQLSSEVLASVEALAREVGGTPFMVLLAAWQLLLSRYARTEDVVVGSPIAGRRVSEVEGLIGFFVNTLVLRTDVGGDPTFRELVERVKTTTLGAYAHQDVPFEKLVGELDVERDTSVTPLFQVMFVYQTAAEAASPRRMSETDSGDEGASPLRLSSLGSGSVMEAFDLSLTLLPDGSGSLSFDVAIFLEATVHRLGQIFVASLERVLEDAEVPIRDVVRNRPEDAAWLEGVSRPQAGTGGSELLPEVLRVRAAEHPGALIAGDTSGARWTYGEADRAADGLARALLAEGVEPEERVGLCVGAGVDRLVGMFGIWRAGAAYVPLDPGYPSERLRRMAEDAGVLRCVCSAGLDVPSPALRRVDVAARSTTGTLAILSPGSCAYVLYTSGSTGRPKGVMVEHASLAAHAAALESRLSLRATDRGLQMTPLSFDVSLEEIAPLLRGGGSVWFDAAGLTSPEALWRLVTDHEITVLQLPAPFWHETVQSLPSELPTSLRAVVVGSDRMSPEACARWQDKVAPSVMLYNAYGPTEATVTSTMWNAEPERRGATVPIGQPVGHAVVRVVDADGQLALRGAPGVLQISGAGVARGYVGRPRETAERFTPDRFGPPGERAYDTGDVGWWALDGNLHFGGRTDAQLKLRGYRIEPGEIESALEEIDGVAQVVVGARGSGATARLVAWVEGSSALSADALREQVAGFLPPFMVPAGFVIMEKFPLTPTGKVDRRALPDPEWSRPGREAEGERESLLAELAAATLGTARVAVDESLFAQGLDSILATQLVWRARERGLPLRVRDIFEHPTVEELARLEFDFGITAEQGPVTGEVPLTPIQRWFLDQGVPRPEWYNQSLGLVVPSGISRELLEGVALDLLAHHDQLRARFERRPDGTWRQTLPRPEDARPVLQHRPSAATGEARWAESERLASALQASLSIEEGRLVAIGYLDFGDEARLFWVVHHLAVDGVSWRILIEDLGARLRGRPLPPKTSSYRNWAGRLHQLAGSAELRAEAEYWRRAAAADIPGLWPGGDPSGLGSHGAHAELDAGVGKALLEVEAPRWKASVEEVLITGLAMALGRVLDRPQLRVTVESHGREEIFDDLDLSRTVGWFTTTYPVLLELPEEASPGELLTRTKQALREVPRGGIGHGLISHLGLDPSERRAVVVPTELLFNYLGRVDRGLAPQEGVGLAPESSGEPSAPENPSLDAATASASVVGGRTHLSLDVGRATADPDLVDAIVEAWTAALVALTEDLAQSRVRYAPSDFPWAGLDQAALDALSAREEEIEAVYPLLNGQQRLAWMSPTSRNRIDQVHYRLKGELDAAALERAVQQLTLNHPILRTELLQLDPATPPVAVVWSSATAEWALGEGAEAERFDTALAAERALLETATGPRRSRWLLRRRGDQDWSLLWTFDAGLVDRWSVSRLMAELFGLLIGTPGASHPERHMARYFERLARNVGEGEAAVSVDPTRAGDGGLSWPVGPQQEVSVLVGASAASDLRVLAASCEAGLDVVMLGAWGLALADQLGQSELVVGFEIEQRSDPVLAGEAVLGPLGTLVPVRLTAPHDDQSLDEWLVTLSEQIDQIRAAEGRITTPERSFAASFSFPRELPQLDAAGLNAVPVRGASSASSGWHPAVRRGWVVEHDDASIELSAVIVQTDDDAESVEVWSESLSRATTRMIEHAKGVPRSAGRMPLLFTSPPTGSAGSPAVWERREGKEGTYFLLQPPLSLSDAYAPLASQMRGSARVISLDIPTDRPDSPWRGWTDLAEYYVPAVLDRRRGDEPIVVGAWSGTGRMGYELARALHEAGCPTAALLLDPIAPELPVTPDAIPSIDMVARHVLHRAEQYAAERGLPLSIPVGDSSIPWVLRQARNVGELVAPRESAEFFSRVRWDLAVQDFLRSGPATPGGFPLAILFSPEFQDLEPAWRRLNPQGMRSTVYEGHHHSWIEPDHVVRLAPVVDAELTRLFSVLRRSEHS